MAVETERKFLIDRPPVELLLSQPGCRVRRITQTYLSAPVPHRQERVRRIEEDGNVTYIHTYKRRLSELSRIEDENEITPEAYEAYLRGAYSALEKTRYSFPFGGHEIEIDVYPDEIGGDALRGFAILEVELQSEDEAISFPEFLRVRGEVTGVKTYSNQILAKRL